MGLIKTVFGGIFGLIGGIFGSIAGIFGIGKKGEYFMELDEASAPATAPAQPAAEPAPAPPAAVASTASQEPALKAVAKPAAAPVKPTAVTQPQAPLVTNFATDYLVNPRINRSPRRRPGPSMSPFKDMVRDMSRKSPSMG